MNEAETLSQEIATTQIARVARRSAKILKIGAAVLAVGAVVNGWLNATIDQNEFYGNPSVDFPLKWKLQQFLYATLGNLGFAGLVLAAGFAIEIVGLRATRLPERSDLPPDTFQPSAPSPEPTNFAARPTPTAASTPQPMQIASDEDLWRR